MTSSPYGGHVLALIRILAHARNFTLRIQDAWLAKRIVI